MLGKLMERIKERECSLGIIMVIVGALFVIFPAKLAGLGLVVYGLFELFWKKNESVIEEHHHHHHHNNATKKKRQTKKKNS
jgi:hypothetical protein